MIAEVITIVAILGGCGAAVWYAKNKFQPEIERNMARKENPMVSAKPRPREK